MLKTTDVSHGPTLEHGSIFPSGPTPENPPKRYLVENVQKNYLPLLFERNKRGNADSTACQIRNAAFIPMLERLILTHMFQSATRKDEHTRSVGPQKLGRANLWERPPARYPSNETSGKSGHQPGGEPLGISANSNAHLERDQSLVSVVG